MCMSIPYKVIEADEGAALVDFKGGRRVVSLLLLDQPVAPGDYVLLQVGDFASDRLDREEAEAVLASIAEILPAPLPAAA